MNFWDILDAIQIAAVIIAFFGFAISGLFWMMSFPPASCKAGPPRDECTCPDCMERDSDD
jgi:hypothetical protein